MGSDDAGVEDRDPITDGASRLLRLLALLQTRPQWAGRDLADRLGVTTRTVRNDVERLRSLGYPVTAAPGTGGGYRLGGGARLPPLILDDDEAVAVALGLRAGAATTVGGLEESSLRAAAKLEQVLPARLRPRLAALTAYTAPVPGAGPSVDPEVLVTLTAACRDHQRLRLDYRDHHGATTVRSTEPHRVVSTGRRWYLLAWDLDRQDWRTFRIDRLTPRTPTGPTFEPRPLPEGNAIEHVTRGVASVLGPCRTTARVEAPASEVSELVPPVARAEHLDDSTCLLHIGAATPTLLAAYLAALARPFHVDGPPELLHALHAMGDRCHHAVPEDHRSIPAVSDGPPTVSG